MAKFIVVLVEIKVCSKPFLKSGGVSVASFGPPLINLQESDESVQPL